MWMRSKERGKGRRRDEVVPPPFEVLGQIDLQVPFGCEVSDVLKECALDERGP